MQWNVDNIITLRCETYVQVYTQLQDKEMNNHEVMIRCYTLNKHNSKK